MLILNYPDVNLVFLGWKYWVRKSPGNWINIPVSLLLKIIIGYSVLPSGRKMKLRAQTNKQSDSLTDGQTDERKDRQVQNTLELWPRADTHQRFILKKNDTNTCWSKFSGQRKDRSSRPQQRSVEVCYQSVTHFDWDHSSACVFLFHWPASGVNTRETVQQERRIIRI